MLDLKRQEIWFLTGSQELYGKETLAKVADNSRAIVDRFRSQGIRIDGAIGIGGVPRRSPFVMQVVADVLNMDIAVPSGEQPVALGAAMFAATAAGLYRRIEDAQRAMAAPIEITYHPDPERARLYESLYSDYLALGAFVEKTLTRSTS